MEAYTAQIHRHNYTSERPFSYASSFKCKPLFISLSYGRCRSTACLPRLSVAVHVGGSNIGNSSSEIRTTLRSDDDQNQDIEGVINSYPIAEETSTGNPIVDESVPEKNIVPQDKTAKIHDFCFGIPFGGVVFSGGLIGFLFSRNPATLTTGVLYGGALLVLSVLSLKIWRQGKSSLPFILGQAVLSAAFLGKHFQTYTLSKKLFPSGFYAVLSAAMLCFYSYVMVSGGNPPPKKKKLATSSS